MKKTLSTIITMLLAALILTGCNTTEQSVPQHNNPTTSEAPTNEQSITTSTSEELTQSITPVKPDAAQSLTPSDIRIASGRYYITADLTGQVLTDDGNLWDYTQTLIADAPSYHNEPVFVYFNTNNTPDDVTDDEIISIVLDRMTKIYDELEVSLSASFELDRDGNNIRIQSLKPVQ